MKTAIFFITLIVGQTFAFPFFIQKQNHVAANPDTAPDLDLCGLCISFAGQFINQLLNIILNAGVVGGCSELCSLLHANQIETAACDILCSIVGVEAFIKIIEEADLDPIYYCELLKTCPIKDDGDATITNLTVTPNQVPKGSTFEIDFTFTTQNGTGTGEIVLIINTRDGLPLSDAQLSKPLQPGSYNGKAEVKAEPDPDCDPTRGPCEMWLPGNYSVEFIVCNGQCGSRHPHSQIYDKKTTAFYVVNN